MNSGDAMGHKAVHKAADADEARALPMLEYLFAQGAKHFNFYRTIIKFGY